MMKNDARALSGTEKASSGTESPSSRIEEVYGGSNSKRKSKRTIRKSADLIDYLS